MMLCASCSRPLFAGETGGVCYHCRLSLIPYLKSTVAFRLHMIENNSKYKQALGKR